VAVVAPIPLGGIGILLVFERADPFAPLRAGSQGRRYEAALRAAMTSGDLTDAHERIQMRRV